MMIRYSFLFLIGLWLLPQTSVVDAQKRSDRQESSCRLQLSLMDGSQIICAPLSHFIKVKTDFGSLKLSFSLLEKILISDNRACSIYFLNGDLVSGELQQESILINSLVLGTNNIYFHQVKQITITCLAQHDKLLAYYAFDQTLEDQSGNNFHGKYQGQPSYKADGTVAIKDPITFIELPKEIIGDSISSISGFFKTSSDKYAQTIIGNYVGCSYSREGFQLIHYGSHVKGGPRLQVYIGGKSVIRTEKINLADSEWHHFVLILSAGSVRLFLDEQFVGQSHMGYVNANLPLKLGNSDKIGTGCGFGNSLNLQGNLDEFAFYAKTLSMEEISRLSQSRRNQ
ncbi:MAG: LamG-like jellyroll fold domain-containing protein [Bacteroidota bacterium]